MEYVSIPLLGGPFDGVTWPTRLPAPHDFHLRSFGLKPPAPIYVLRALRVPGVKDEVAAYVFPELSDEEATRLAAKHIAHENASRVSSRGPSPRG